MLLITTTTSSSMLQQLLLPTNYNKESSSSPPPPPPSRFCCSNSNKRNRRLAALIIPNSSSDSGRKHRSWWQKFFFDEDCNWLGFNDHGTEQLQEEEEEVDRDSERVMSEDEKFEAWKRRAEAITELREAQDDLTNEESRSWEDWLIPSPDNPQSQSDWDSDTQLINNNTNDGYPFPQDQDGSLVRSLRNLVLGNDDDDDLLYEDRVFRYASTNSAKFLAVLIIVPCALDFLVHDYLLMPFLDRYVKTVPLAAQMLDVRRPQKLEIIEELKMEKARLRLEVEIGKSPPLSDDQAWWELRDKALELREEWRLHNRSAFANIWSDMVFGVSLFILLYLNQTKVALLKFTGYKIINNISDTGKAFLIILITDIFLGYHSESGWQTLVEVLVEHYGFEVDQSVITIFICLVPVIIDACVKLWLFKFLPRLSPKVANLFREMTRH
ncbi:Proton extrusion protein PcxA [Morus notabilis]|uniref:Proton extrusion protein PcxA n=1 Tax=Morus notabilis TaxID=981085 RepID=W9QYA9_9ROSA|nr:chloroplast envelope membrane protein [Morus notabilis]EXB58674.1 Proton extrusion protein PcxA [Morus notabilis]